MADSKQASMTSDGNKGKRLYRNNSVLMQNKENVDALNLKRSSGCIADAGLVPSCLQLKTSSSFLNQPSFTDAKYLQDS